MASLLESKVSQLIAQGFSGKLLTGTLRRETIGALDNAGDASSPTVTTYSCQGIVDSFNAVYAAAAGIPVTDARILLIAGLVATVPRQDDKVKFRDQWYQIRKIVSVDPANASYTLAGFAISAP